MNAFGGEQEKEKQVKLGQHRKRQTLNKGNRLLGTPESN